LSNAKSNPPAGAAEEHIPIRLLLQIRSKAEPASLVPDVAASLPREVGRPGGIGGVTLEVRTGQV